jgi:hypothetical protein
MFRKSIIATAAIATLVTAALPSTASAHRRHHGLYLGLGVATGLAIVGAGAYASCPVVYEWRVNRYGRWYQVPVRTCY